MNQKRFDSCTLLHERNPKCGAVATGSVHAKSDIVGADTANVVTAAQVFNGDVMSYLLKS